MRSNALLEERLTQHQAAVREFIDRARAINSDRWLTPRAEGKWTPAQETRHVILAYHAFLRQLRSSERSKPKVSWVYQKFARLIGLSSILYRGRIPVAVKAPRVTRPDWETATAQQLLPELQAIATEFEATLAEKWRAAPGTRCTHPLFGPLTLDHTIRFIAVHTRHHAAFLPR